MPETDGAGRRCNTDRPLPTMEHVFDAIDKRTGQFAGRRRLSTLNLNVAEYGGVGTGYDSVSCRTGWSPAPAAGLPPACSMRSSLR